ncbi:MAG: recombinase family protein, partial [Candidatus Peregrinibacteria bacterium]|nr:recombinase family protein [Candidatus Peregrinibacteria bacterium]
IKTMTEYAEKNEIKIRKTFIDSGSAHKVNNRDNFTAMMDDIKSGRIDSILTWKADRLARNMIEGGLIIYLIQNGILKVIQTPFAQFLPSQNTLPLTIEFGMSNQYSIDLSTNIKRGNQTKTQNGGWCSVAPHGYLNERISKTVVLDQNRYHLIRKMWDLYLTGAYSIGKICKIANDEWGFKTIKKKKSGGVPMSESSLHAIFTNPFYYGWVKNGEDEGWGNHKPMVTKQEFEEIQKILRRAGKSKPEKYEFSFTGCMKCGECGSSITAEEKVKYFCPECSYPQTSKNPHDCKKCEFKLTKKHIENANWYTYYRCTKKKNKKCTQKCIRENKLESQIIKVLDDVEIDNDFEAWAIKWLKHIHNENSKLSQFEQKSLKRSLKTSQERLKALFDMRLDKEINEIEYKERKKELEEERDNWANRMKKALNKSDKDLNEAEDEFYFVENIKKRFETGSIEERKYIFFKIGSNLILKDQELSLSLKKEYLLIKNLKQYAPDMLEPPESLSNRDFLDDPKCKYPIWYR